jgi:hypothetical protein
MVHLVDPSAGMGLGEGTATESFPGQQRRSFSPRSENLTVAPTVVAAFSLHILLKLFRFCTLRVEVVPEYSL